MRKPDNRDRQTTSAETAPAALSPAAEAVGVCLGQWRTRIAESQTLSRLTLSLLQGPTAMSEERREQLGRLISIEERALAQLPRLDLASLRSTTNARESGIDLRGPDIVMAERYLESLRSGVGAQLTRLAADIPSPNAALSGVIENARRSLDELARLIDLLETVLYPRMNDPTIAISQALERAAGSRTQTVTLVGDSSTLVQQVRGLMRLLCELISTVGDNAYAHAFRDGSWLYLTISPMATSVGPEDIAPGLVELLRFAAYILRVKSDRVDGSWQLALVAYNA